MKRNGAPDWLVMIVDGLIVLFFVGLVSAITYLWERYG